MNSHMSSLVRSMVPRRNLALHELVAVTKTSSIHHYLTSMRMVDQLCTCSMKMSSHDIIMKLFHLCMCMVDFAVEIFALSILASYGAMMVDTG